MVHVLNALLNCHGMLLSILQYDLGEKYPGIDGIIKEDILGLDVIYIQAKRWDTTIGRPEIHKFAWALQGQRAKKGIFITTGKFSSDALEYTKNIDTKIVLIDGNQLALSSILKG
jgi:restriction endonuclease Mrr